ncbi:uncharacterized protein LOC129786182 [Lutzomyia longipalpis]|uniref:uncharacterized protein LOC129786182 n=1 Tax=Lutzomyia longipalpis TaxID=7200 RepID=UPI0024833926|nr:uncharacterized protein LOC129786182 [Lutzomyia longipalpis]
MKTKKPENQNFPVKSHNKLHGVGKVNHKSAAKDPGSRHKSRNQTQINYVVNPRKLKFLTNKKAAEEKREAHLADKEKRRKEIEHKRKEKIQRNRELSKKTRRGQPVMKNQIEFLLNKIQKRLAEE